MPVVAEKTSPGDSAFQADRESWRTGYDAGLKHGAARYFNAPVMEDLALELTILRATVAAMSATATKREKLLAHYRQKFDECVALIVGRK